MTKKKGPDALESKFLRILNDSSLSQEERLAAFVGVADEHSEECRMAEVHETFSNCWVEAEAFLADADNEDLTDGYMGPLRAVVSALLGIGNALLAIGESVNAIALKGKP